MAGNEVTTGYTTPNRQGEYARIAVLLPKAIERLEELLDHPNCNVRLGAVNKVLDKCLPDLRATELTGQQGQPIKIQIISYGDNDPLKLYASSPNATGPQSSSPVSGPQLAQEGTKDDTSDKPVNPMG